NHESCQAEPTCLAPRSPQSGGAQRVVIHSLDELRARGHDYEVIDGDALSDAQRREFYGDAYVALVNNGNRYRIRQVFGSRRHGGGDFLGAGVPALILYENGEPIDVYPHQVADGYE